MQSNRCQWVVYNPYSRYKEPLWVECGLPAVEQGLCEQHLEAWKHEEKVARLKRQYFPRNNPDVDVRQLERSFAADPTPQIAERLMNVYQRLGRELDYLKLLDQFGPELRQHTYHAIGPQGYARNYISRLTPQQEQRFQLLYWQELRDRAETGDRAQEIDVALLQEAETLVNRRLHNPWRKAVFVVTHETHPDDRVLDDYTRFLDEEDTVRLVCKDHDETEEFFASPEAMEAFWSEYWASEDGQKALQWHLDREEDPENDDYYLKWINESSNTYAIEWLYSHRRCINEEEDFDDGYGNYVPDTPSLPPVGTEDPNW